MVVKIRVTLISGEECEVDTHVFEADVRAEEESVLTIEAYGIDYIITDAVPIPNVVQIAELFPDFDCQQLSRFSGCVDILIGVGNEHISRYCSSSWEVVCRSVNN